MSYEEFPAYFQSGSDRLFSLICSPASTELRDVGVVLLTGGNYTRTHRNRMWVRTARDLAEHGFASMRLDYHGVGDSTGSGVMDLEKPFTSDVMAAVDFLISATGVSRVALVATCFGGRNAIPAAARHPAVVSATIFPLPIMMPRTTRPPATMRSRSKNWLKSRMWGSRFLRHPAVRSLKRKTSTSTAHASRVSPTFKRDLVTFLARGRIRFVYGESSDGLGDIRRCIDEITPRLSELEREHLELEIAPDTVLTGFQSLEDQDIVVQRSVASVLELASDDRQLGGLISSAAANQPHGG